MSENGALQIINDSILSLGDYTGEYSPIITSGKNFIFSEIFLLTSIYPGSNNVRSSHAHENQSNLKSSYCCDYKLLTLSATSLADRGRK